MFARISVLKFSRDEKVDETRYGVNWDTGLRQDFGPSLLLPYSTPVKEEEKLQ
jgi:hypothetical protein